MGAQEAAADRGAGDDRVVEAVCRGLLTLVRSVRVYPGSHPLLGRTAERVLEAAAAGPGLPLVLGIAPDRVILHGAFVGGPGTRAGALAEFLHGRQVAQVEIRGGAAPEDLVGFARALSNPGLSGEALAADLCRRGVRGVRVKPLDLGRLHQSFRETRAGPPGEGDERGRRVWAWLLEGAGGAPVGSGGRGAPDDLAAFLRRERSRLDQTLAALPPGAREGVEERLRRLGQGLSLRQLAGILAEARDEGGLGGGVVDALLPDPDEGRLVDVLAALVSLEGRDSQRLADVYRHFSSGSLDGLLRAVRERAAGRAPGGFGAHVWKALETFLLDLREERFMGGDYEAELDRLARLPEAPGPEAGGPALDEDPEPHLDRVVLALVELGELAPERALERVRARIGQADPGQALALVREVGRRLPAALSGSPDLVREVFRKGVDGLRRLDEPGRRALAGFFTDHEDLLLEDALKALATDGRMAARRFLVGALSRTSPKATPALVARTRSGPWYVARNLAIVLGNRRDPRSLPALRALARHPHPKVRREAILALGRLGTAEAVQVLGRIARSRRAGPAERDLARRILRAREPGKGGP